MSCKLIFVLTEVTLKSSYNKFGIFTEVITLFDGSNIIIVYYKYIKEYKNTYIS